MTDEPIARIARDSWREAAADAREVEIHWREAHNHAGDAPTGSGEAARLRAEMQGLQEEYVRLIEEARTHGRWAVLRPLPAILADAPIHRDGSC